MARKPKTVLGKILQTTVDVGKAATVGTLVKATTGRDLKYSSDLGAKIGRTTANVGGILGAGAATFFTGGLAAAPLAASQLAFRAADAKKEAAIAGQSSPVEGISNTGTVAGYTPPEVYKNAYSDGSATLPEDSNTGLIAAGIGGLILLVVVFVFIMKK